MSRAAAIQTLGYNAGLGTTVASGSTTHTKGSWVAMGTTEAPWVEFELSGIAVASTVRFLIDVAIGAAREIIVSNLLVYPGGLTAFRVRLPVEVPANTEVAVRTQGSSGNSVIAMLLRGVKLYPDAERGYAAAIGLNLDTANTRAGAINVPLTNAWTEIIASTSRDYRALMFHTGDNGTNPTTSQNAGISLGVGAAAAEAEIASGFIRISASSFSMLVPPILVPSPIAAGSRIAAKAQAPVTGDNIRIPVMGLY